MSSRPALPPEFVQRFKKQRIRNATAEAVAEFSYAGASVAHIVKAAGVARNTFYENYGGKHPAFVATVEEGRELFVTKMLEAIALEDTVRDRVWAGVRAAVAWAEENRALMKCVLVETPAGAPEVRERLMVELTAMTGLQYEMGEMVAGGFVHIFYTCALRDTAYTDVEEELFAFVLAAFPPVLV